jgi:hypothetical protein
MRGSSFARMDSRGGCPPQAPQGLKPNSTFYEPVRQDWKSCPSRWCAIPDLPLAELGRVGSLDGVGLRGLDNRNSAVVPVIEKLEVGNPISFVGFLLYF